MTNKQLTKMDTTCKQIQQMEPRFLQALGTGDTKFASRFTNTAIMAVKDNPDLLKTEPRALLRACLKAATDGLILDGRQAALAIFGGKAQYMPMVRGIIDRVMNSGELLNLYAYCAYENDDHFSYKLGLNPDIQHVPTTGNRGERTHVYAVAHLKNGTVQFVVMSKEDVMGARSVAKTKKVWDGPFKGEMWKKTAIHRLSKILPSSATMENFMRQIESESDFSKADDANAEPEVQTAEEAGQTQSRASQAILQDADISDAEFEEAPPNPPAEAYEEDII